MSNSTSLDLVLEKAGHDGCCVGWVYKPRKAYFIRRSNTPDSPWLRLERSEGRYHETAEDFSMAYEITIFGSEVQHKWTHKYNGKGAWGITSDSSGLKTQDIELHLWGEVTPDEGLNGLPWTKVSGSRTGSLFVPTKTQGNPAYITLKQRNYLDEDSFGNIFINSSRYVGFASTDGNLV